MDLFTIPRFAITTGFKLVSTPVQAGLQLIGIGDERRRRAAREEAYADDLRSEAEAHQDAAEQVREADHGAAEQKRKQAGRRAQRERTAAEKQRKARERRAAQA